MPDFSWTRQHALIRPRAEVQADFEQLGYRFTATDAADSAGDGAGTGRPRGRPGRPRGIGERDGGRTRVELIGPPEAVFKATLLAAAPDGSVDGAPAELLRVMAPGWEEGVEWVRDQLELLDEGGSAETRYAEFLVLLRRPRGGAQVVLGLTWLPAGPGPVESAASAE